MKKDFDNERQQDKEKKNNNDMTPLLTRAASYSNNTRSYRDHAETQPDRMGA